jgi:Putative peptidoglycan binding domain
MHTANSASARSLAVLRRNSTGEDVRFLQEQLNAIQFFRPGSGLPLLAADGIFGPMTESAVRSFQRAEGILVDGIVGTQTWSALFRVVLPITKFAFNVHPFRVMFAPGTRSAVLENGVVRGDRDVYIVQAMTGQRMKLKISSFENNAVYDLSDPFGAVLQQEARQGEIVLPMSHDFQTGYYYISVGGTRGNATYQLWIEII